MLVDYVAGTTETIILTPKKQGKSTIVASVDLFHLVTTPDAEGHPAERVVINLLSYMGWQMKRAAQGRGGRPASGTPILPKVPQGVPLLRAVGTHSFGYPRRQGERSAGGI
jgi:hypothetical protein